jgi:Tfp pilus assembly protein PilO
MNRPIIIVICIFIIIILGVLLIWPKYQILKASLVNVEKKASELKHLTDDIADLKKISEDLKGYEAELLKIESALPSDPSLPSLLGFIQTKASENGLVLKNFSSVSVSPFAKDSDIKEQRLSIELSGFYPAFKNFLAVLEKSGRLIEIEQISFSSPKEKEPIFFTVGIKVYSY